MATPAAALGGSPEPVVSADLDSAVDAAFDAKLGTGDTTPPALNTPDDTPPAGQADPGLEPEAKSAEAEQPAVEEGAAAEKAPVEEPLDPYEKIEPDKITDGGKTWHFRENKARSLLAAQEFQRAVQETIPGATLETVKGIYENSVIMEEFIGDYDSGDPARIGKVADFFFDNRANPESVMALAQQLPDRLLASHPEAFRSLENAITQRTINRLYNEAAKSGDEQLLSLAQNLHFRHGGTFYKKEDLQAGPESALAERERRLQADVQKFNSERTRESQQRTEQRRQEIDGMENTTIQEEIEKALEPVAVNFKDKPAWKHMTRDLAEAVEQARAANPVFKRQFDSVKLRALRDPSEDAKKSVAAMIRQFVAPIIGRQRKAVIEAETKSVLSASAAAHSKQLVASKRVETGGAASPTARSISAQKLREAKTLDDAFAVLGWNE